MIKVKAILNLYDGQHKRQTAFVSGYRPLFKFMDNMYVSGQITLINQVDFKPGDKGLVYISFLNDTYLGNHFEVGRKVKFYEGEEPLGEAEVIEIC
ncbi:MAG TPA: hypothetical protein VKY82_05640 [Flavobacterium sp.]|nr:hypothetical protein [Flavobacterium sp.]